MGLTLSSTWQVQEAKSRFSELLDRVATEGPQIITRHGKPVARVVPVELPEDSARAREALPAHADGPAMSFAEFLLSAPKIEGGLPEMPREGGTGRAPMFGES